MQKLAAYMLCLLILSGCVGPETKRERLEKYAEPCLSGQNNLDVAMSCLKRTGYSQWQQHRDVFLYKSCGLYWGYPLVASCSGINIESQGNNIKSYKLWAELDGV